MKNSLNLYCVKTNAILASIELKLEVFLEVVEKLDQCEGKVN